jgi:hypothetical protein
MDEFSAFKTSNQMPSWPRPKSIVAGLLVIATATSAAAQVSPAPSIPSIRITLAPSQEEWRAPLMEAAQQAASIAREWLGPHPTGAVEIAVTLPFWQGPGAMWAERQVAATVIRSWWPQPLTDQHAELLLDGFARYLQGHAIEQLFDQRHLRRAYRAESVEYFGGQVIWSFPSLRRVRLPDENDRQAAVFSTLERWLGEPGLQAAMAEVAKLPRGGITGNAVMNTISAAAGQDLGWVFTPAADEAPIDYAVTHLTSAPGSCGSPCFDTSVTVARHGPMAITGRSTPRIGGFQSGDALLLRVAFADGSQSDARWDGRDQSRLFRFQGPSPAIAASLDPDRIVATDQNFLNNSVVRPVTTNVPVRKWMARWMVWMQNTILTYGFFG